MRVLLIVALGCAWSLSAIAGKYDLAACEKMNRCAECLADRHCVVLFADDDECPVTPDKPTVRFTTDGNSIDGLSFYNMMPRKFWHRRVHIDFPGATPLASGKKDVGLGQGLQRGIPLNPAAIGRYKYDVTNKRRSSCPPLDPLIIIQPEQPEEAEGEDEDEAEDSDED